MVYKIIGEFNDYILDKIIKKISEDFVFLYYNNSLYISFKDINTLSRNSFNVKDVLKGSKNLALIEINQNNILLEDEIAGEWCKNRFVDLEKQKFEKDK